MNRGTLADGLMSINRREDFDAHREDFLGRAWAWEAVRDFVVFVWGIREADVFLTFLDGGLLRQSYLRYAAWKVSCCGSPVSA